MGSEMCIRDRYAFGFATKAKTSLVARGNIQREFVDFADLYAPTVATSSMRLFATSANDYDFELCHFDVDQAFVRADLKKDVFMRLPEGCGELSGKIVKLNKSLYGLRQKSRPWYAMLKKCLLALGFEQCLADSCVFRLIRGEIVVLILVVHVDDIFAVGKKERCDHLGEDLNRMVPVKNLGELKWYSGCFYERQRGREAEDFTADVHGRVGREV